MIKATVLKINNIEKGKIFWFLSTTMVLFLGLYIYFVTQTIINTASYKTTEQNIAALDSKIGELESKYISLKKEVDIDLTKKLGYVDALDIKFIDKQAFNKSPSLVSLSK
jgi:hypothetical protein